MKKRINKLYSVDIVRSTCVYVEAEDPQEAKRIARAVALDEVSSEDFEDSVNEISSVTKYARTIDDLDEYDRIFTIEGEVKYDDYFDQVERQECCCLKCAHRVRHDADYGRIDCDIDGIANGHKEDDTCCLFEEREEGGEE